MPDYGYLFTENNLPKTLIEKLNYIRHNRYVDDEHYYVGNDKDGNFVFKNENNYGGLTYPDCGIRLLSLYRYWNIIQYFYPNRHLIGEDWNKVLSEFIPEFCNAPDALAYELACLKLIARIHDSHATILNPLYPLDNFRGTYYPPFNTAFIENKLVVTRSANMSNDDENKILVGDIIEKIDGVSVEELIKKYLPLTPASNYETQLREMLTPARGFLLCGKNPEREFAINRNGKSLTKKIICIQVNATSTNDAFYNNETKGFRLIGTDIGYIYPAYLKVEDINGIKILFKNTKGIVIDMRCYPSIFMPYTYGAWLKNKTTPFAIPTLRDINNPGYFEFSDAMENGDTGSNCYTGKIVIIVNATTQSQAEFTAMALRTASRALVIGSTTTGADGDVTVVTLPGNIQTWISGVGILYPDSSESQRVGVKIDKVVKPTIKGIKEGRDELLDEAIRIIRK